MPPPELHLTQCKINGCQVAKAMYCCNVQCTFLKLMVCAFRFPVASQNSLKKMDSISCLLWHLFLPPEFGLSDHITLQLHVVSYDCGHKSSDRIRDGSKVHASKQRGIDRERWKIWQSVCVLAPCYCVGTASIA